MGGRRGGGKEDRRKGAGLVQRVACASPPFYGHYCIPVENPILTLGPTFSVLNSATSTYLAHHSGATPEITPSLLISRVNV